MKLRTVTDVERSLEEGLAPKRLQTPRSREDVLAPFDQRERAMVVCIANAIKNIGLTQEDPHAVAAWKELLTGFQTFTGVNWHEAARYW